MTGAEVPLGLKTPLGCCVILCYINFCPDLHPWSSACEVAECLSITRAGDPALVVLHGSAVPAAMSKLLLSSIFHYNVFPFYYPSKWLSSSQTSSSSLRVFLMPLPKFPSVVFHMSQLIWLGLTVALCLSICFLNPCRFLGWCFSIPELSSVCTVMFYLKTCGS